ncbi:MAG: TatD family hydrolase [Treponema sp.]|jgi:TatD DNase family protein|nr:TatD family hydrolase [Treponema sp.]
MHTLIDTHAHLSGLEGRGIDTRQTLADLFSKDNINIIDISLEPGDLSTRIHEFSCYNRVHFASGLWPWSLSITNREKMVMELEKDIIALRKHICALGEFGLDHNRNHENLEGERELMEMQMDMAQKLELPVIIHSRDAAKETAEVLARYPQVRGVVHCFSYGPTELQSFLRLGYFISFAGNITYKNARNIQEACKAVPPDKLFLETDCPYLAPVPHRGKPAHPGMVEEVYKKAAEIRETDLPTLAEQIEENVKTLFGF